MSVLMLASAINGLPVVSVADGEDLAEVRDVIYDPALGRLVGMTLNKRGFLAGRCKNVLPAASVRAIGADAVTVPDGSAVISPADAPDDVAAPPKDRNVLGNDVLTEGGTSLGAVSDLVVEVGGTGEVVGYQITTADKAVRYVPLPAQLAVSGAALVVPDTAQEFVRDDLVGLGGAVASFRERLGA